MIFTLLWLIHLRLFKVCFEVLHERILNLINPNAFHQDSDFNYFLSVRYLGAFWVSLFITEWVWTMRIFLSKMTLQIVGKFIHSMRLTDHYLEKFKTQLKVENPENSKTTILLTNSAPLKTNAIARLHISFETSCLIATIASPSLALWYADAIHGPHVLLCVEMLHFWNKT